MARWAELAPRPFLPMWGWTGIPGVWLPSFTNERGHLKTTASPAELHWPGHSPSPPWISSKHRRSFPISSAEACLTFGFAYPSLWTVLWCAVPAGRDTTMGNSSRHHAKVDQLNFHLPRGTLSVDHSSSTQFLSTPDGQFVFWFQLKAKSRQWCDPTQWIEVLKFFSLSLQICLYEDKGTRSKEIKTSLRTGSFH